MLEASGAPVWYTQLVLLTSYTIGRPGFDFWIDTVKSVIRYPLVLGDG